MMPCKDCVANQHTRVLDSKSPTSWVSKSTWDLSTFISSSRIETASTTPTPIQWLWRRQPMPFKQSNREPMHAMRLFSTVTLHMVLNAVAKWAEDCLGGAVKFRINSFQFTPISIHLFLNKFQFNSIHELKLECIEMNWSLF